MNVWRRTGEPYWIILPALLQASFSRQEKENPGADSFLGDVLWGQYCIFLATRILDDIVDRDLSRSTFQAISRKFESEASRVFRRCLGGHSEFRRYYLQCVVSAKDAHKRVGRLDGPMVRVSKRTLEAEYKTVSGIFKIGSAAVCARFGKFHDLKGIEVALEQLAVIGQISDDLMDLEEDLAGGRLNYVARYFLRSRSVRSVSSSQIWQQILSSLHFTDAASRLCLELNHHLFLASEAFSRSGVIGCRPLIDRYAKVLYGLDTVLQERRSSYFLTLINQTPGSPQNPGNLFRSVRGRSWTASGRATGE